MLQIVYIVIAPVINDVPSEQLQTQLPPKMTNQNVEKPKRWIVWLTAQSVMSIIVYRKKSDVKKKISEKV